MTNPDFFPPNSRPFQAFPCLSNSGRRSSLVVIVAIVVLHFVFLGVLFLFDDDLVSKTKTEPWYTAIYLLLFAATVVQYLITANSSPGYVLDAMREVDNSTTVNENARMTLEQPASRKNGSSVITVDRNQPRSSVETHTTSWAMLVWEMYPPGTSVRTFTCSYCYVEQPPRAKHCYECDRCVLQFDHHCVWLGTCIGQGNHCRYWWYICEETALCLWTGILYITYLMANISNAWWKSAIIIFLLVTLSLLSIFLLLLMIFHCYLILTNQTTYELVRRKRISYLRGIPDGVYPFSKGICRNLYNFCCARTSIYDMTFPSEFELEEKLRPYTCFDLLRCRCCC